MPAAVIAILGVALAFAGGATAAPIDANWDAVAGVSVHPFTTDEGNLACIPWADPSGITTRNCDPVNVVFPDQTIEQVQLRLAAAGWTVGGGTIQRLHFGSAMTWDPPALHMVFVQDELNRFHVRLWQVGTAVIGAVHHDLGSTSHVVDISWDTSEAFLAGPLCSSWCGRVQLPHQLAIQGGPTWRGLPNDGIATVIPLAAPPPTSATAVIASVAPRKHHRHHHKPKPPS